MRFYIRERKRQNIEEWHKVFIIFPRQLYDGDDYKSATEEWAWFEVVERKRINNPAQRSTQYIHRAII